MKISTILLICCLFFACKSASEDGVLPNKKKYKNLRVMYIEDVCCSNMRLLDDVRIESENGSYNYDLLAVTNIEELPDTLAFGDTLTVTIIYSDGAFMCETICNAPNGIRVAIEDWAL